MWKTTIAVVSLSLLLSSCIQIEEPEFRAMEDFQVKEWGLDTVSIGFGITYFNPNNFSITVKETGADVYIDSAFLGKFQQDRIVEVGENSSFTLSLSGSIPVSNFLRLNLKDIHRRDIWLRAEGSTRVGKAGIFLSKKINYAGRHRFDEIRF